MEHRSIWQGASKSQEWGHDLLLRHLHDQSTQLKFYHNLKSIFLKKLTFWKSYFPQELSFQIDSKSKTCFRGLINFNGTFYAEFIVVHIVHK